VFAALKAKLDARPVWARLALLEALPADLRDAAKKHLPIVAYRFANGPFRRLWWGQQLTFVHYSPQHKHVLRDT
jgi:hypothetical protein